MKEFLLLNFQLLILVCFFCSTAILIHLYIRRNKQVNEQSKEINRLHILVNDLKQNDETKVLDAYSFDSLSINPSQQIEVLKKKIKEIYQQQTLNYEEWQEIERLIDYTMNNFASKLRASYNMLSEEEIRILLFIRIGIDNNQIASFYNILPASFATRRYRIIKKMGVKDVDSISLFVKKLFN